MAPPRPIRFGGGRQKTSEDGQSVRTSLLAGIAALGLLASPIAGPSLAQTAEELEAFFSQIEAQEQRVEPFRVFDDLYYVGIGWVSTWLLDTGDGLVLIDASYGEYVDHVLAGVRKLGFDPADIRYLLVTHAHFDHAGGAKAIQAATGARVAMTEADWRLLEKREPLAGGAPQAFEPPARDLVLGDGQQIELGRARITAHVTPGHTPGVLSLAFTVHDRGAPHAAFTFGGVGLNFSGVERTEQYLASVRRLMALDGIAVNVSNHPEPGRIFERAAALAMRGESDPHPFVDPEAFEAWLGELLAGGETKLEQERRAQR